VPQWQWQAHQHAQSGVPRRGDGECGQDTNAGASSHLPGCHADLAGQARRAPLVAFQDARKLFPERLAAAAGGAHQTANPDRDQHPTRIDRTIRD
jgi:hypothetical protein